MLDLFPRQMQRAPRYEWRHERRQSSVMPPAFADSRKGRFAEAHFEFMAEHKANNEFLAIRLCALAAGHRGGEDVGGMRRILLPIDVVVVHAADHQRIRE